MAFANCSSCFSFCGVKEISPASVVASEEGSEVTSGIGQEGGGVEDQTPMLEPRSVALESADTGVIEGVILSVSD